MDQQSIREDIERLKQRIRTLEKGATDLASSGDVDARALFAELSGLIQKLEQQQKINQQGNRARLEELRQRLILGNEIERTQLASHLHDGPLQDLYGVFYQVNLVLSEMEEGAARDRLLETREMLQHILNDLRMTSYELRPPALSHYGLGKAILSYSERFKAQYPWLQVHLTLATDDRRLPEDVRMVLFHNFQQLMSNIARHARAENIWISLTIEGDQVRMIVRDDGSGFQVPDHWLELVRQKRLGLAGCAERTSALGGEFHVESDASGGSTACTIIPIPSATIYRHP